jgi:hypothetical protein
MEHSGPLRSQTQQPLEIPYQNYKAAGRNLQLQPAPYLMAEARITIFPDCALKSIIFETIHSPSNFDRLINFIFHASIGYVYFYHIQIIAQ